MSTPHLLDDKTATSSVNINGAHSYRLEKAHVAPPESAEFIEGTLRGWLTVLGGYAIVHDTATKKAYVPR